MQIRVFDLISHRCIHEVEVTSSVAKMDISRDNSSLSSNSGLYIIFYSHPFHHLFSIEFLFILSL